MKDKILSFNEVDTLNRNLRMIDDGLGYQAPRIIMDSEELSKKILSFEEVDTIVRNLRMLDNSQGHQITIGESIANSFYWIVGVPFVIAVLARFLGLF